MILLGSGKCSEFGGMADSGVGNQEGLSLIEPSDLTEWYFNRIFLQGSFDDNFGLARNLNPMAFYIAMRWSFTSFNGIQGEILPGYSREQIRRSMFNISFAGKSLYAQPADWGPNSDTGRLIDCSPGILLALGAKTDDVLTVRLIS